MDLLQIQQEAWTTAEVKGLHKNLDHVTQLGTREQALLALAPLYAAVTALTQEIKRHGTEDVTLLFDLVEDLVDEVSAFERKRQDLKEPFKISPEDFQEAAQIRLVLTHSEIDEGIAALECDITEVDLVDVGEELADVIIRLADLAHCLNIDLGACVEQKLAYNRSRPFGYGTPLEQ